MYKPQDYQITTEIIYLSPSRIIRMGWIMDLLPSNFNLVTPMYILRPTLSTTGRTSHVTKIISSEDQTFLSILLRVREKREIK